MYEEGKNKTLAKMIRYVTYQINTNTVILENILNGSENTLKIVKRSCFLKKMYFLSSLN